MKKITLVCILVLISILLVMAPSCAKKVPVFELSNLSVSPEPVVSGENATISVDIKNTGNAEGAYPAVLKIDDIQVDKQNVTIKPGASQKVTFSVVKKEPGNHVASFDNVTQAFTVLKSAEFKLSGLKVTPAQVVTGESATVTVDVANTGEVKGDYQVTLKVRGVDVETKKVSLASGATQTLSFTVSTKEPGSYAIGVGSLTQNLMALKPAEFKVAALKVPVQVLAGWSATVTVDVTNVGEMKGDYQVALKIDGKEVDSKKVSLAGGATEPVSFTIVQDQGGIYQLSVGGQSGTLAVKEGVLPPLQVGDQWVYRVNDAGTMYTFTYTITGEETVDGKACYVVKRSHSPNWGGWIPERTEWWEKATLSDLRWQFSAQSSSGGMLNRTWSYSYAITGSQWPLAVGSSFTMKETIKKVDVQGGRSSPSETTGGTLTYKIENIETIKINAGEFRAFKVVVYDSSGKALAEEWYSDKAKAFIKVKYPSSDNSVELLSFTVKGSGL